MDSDDSSTSTGRDDRIQLNVTLTRAMLDQLREALPIALEDSERIRQAVADSIERHTATEFAVRRH